MNDSIGQYLQSQFLYNPPGKRLYCHACSLIKAPSGDLIAVWYAYPEVEHLGATLVMARRPAGETVWGESRTILEGQAYSVGNPVLYCTQDGQLHLLFVLLKGTYWDSAELVLSRSDDNGHTWSLPVPLGLQTGLMIRHAPIAVENGAQLLPAYEERSRRSVILIGRPPEWNWELHYRFEDVSLIQPVLVSGSSEQLRIFFRPVTEPKQIWRSQSSDRGRTWATPVRTPLPNPLSGISAFSLGQRIAMIYNHTEKHERHPLSISTSTDAGLTWQPPRHLDTVEHELSYPFFVHDSSRGQVHGVYSYNRRMIKYIRLDAGEL